ncbi:MAG: cell division protein FtsX [Rhizomicrobium sp.]
MSAYRPGRIMPRWEGAAPLDLAIGVMAFLAALAVGASLVTARTAKDWQAGLAGAFTVQVLPPSSGAIEPRWQNEIEAAILMLRRTPGVARVDVVSEADTRALVAPWLGSGTLPSELPLPRLIDAAITRGARVDLPQLARRLKQAAPDSLLDDHGTWLLRLRSAAATVIWSAWGILALIAVAAAATVTFATRAGLAAHQPIVSLLHQMGARREFIARAFEWHYFASALAASALATALAALLFLAAGGLEFVGVEAVPFLPPLGLGPLELPWLFAVPVAAGIIALATARISVFSALARNY